MTTHKGIIHAVHHLHRGYRIYNIHLNRNSLNVQFYTDHLLVKNRYLGENKRAWIYTTENFTVAYPCTNSSEVGDTIRRFADDVGIPDIIRSDLAPYITVEHM